MWLYADAGCVHSDVKADNFLTIFSAANSEQWPQPMQEGALSREREASMSKLTVRSCLGVTWEAGRRKHHTTGPHTPTASHSLGAGLAAISLLHCCGLALKAIPSPAVEGGRRQAHGALAGGRCGVGPACPVQPTPPSRTHGGPVVHADGSGGMQAHAQAAATHLMHRVQVVWPSAGW